MEAVFLTTNLVPANISMEILKSFKSMLIRSSLCVDVDSVLHTLVTRDFCILEIFSGHFTKLSVLVNGFI